MNKYELLEYTSIRYPTLPLKSYNIIENIPADKYTDYFSKEEISQIEMVFIFLLKIYINPIKKT